MSEIAGLDFSSAKPDPATLVRDGFRFVVGYLKPLLDGGAVNPKELTADYVARARAAGLAVLAVFESTADRALSGAAGGAADGATAKARAAALGYPPDAVVFWAVDFDVSAAQLPTVLAYGDAFAAAVGHPDGGYGSLALVEALAAHRPSSFRWQTAAWSGGTLSPHAHLYQRATPSGHWPVMPGTDEDVLCAPLPWYGPGAAPAPQPVNPTPPPAFDVRAWRAHAGAQGFVFQRLQQWANRFYPAYAHIGPVAPVYGPQTVAFLAEFCRRLDIVSDGKDIGPRTAQALYDQGFRG